MPNLMQKLIYNLSAAAPLCVIFAFVWWSEFHTYKIPLVGIICFAILVLGFSCSFMYGKKNLPPVVINVSDISPHDAGIVAYFTSYVLPFASMAIKDFDLVLSGIIAIAIILIAPFVNSAIPHPLLFLRGYHFYQVGTDQGVSGYVLISKRKLRNPHEMKYVKRIFEFLLLDEVK